VWVTDASGPGVSAPLGNHHADVKWLRALLRDRRTRNEHGVFVCEGPRVVTAALDQEVPLVEVLVGVDATPAARAVAGRAVECFVPVRELADGVSARLSATTTAQGVFAVAPLRRAGVDALAGASLVVVAPAIADPGNVGTLMRSAAAAGAEIIVLGPGSVDAYNPKTVRASAGACFAVQIVEGVPAVTALEALRSAGVRSVGALAAGGSLPEAVDLAGPVAIVLGHEVHGLATDLRLDAAVTIPMRSTESLNVAMAGTVLLFEAARQRRARA
jgi:RNA methyltransferase, TrmH family